MFLINRKSITVGSQQRWPQCAVPSADVGPPHSERLVGFLFVYLFIFLVRLGHFLHPSFTSCWRKKKQDKKQEMDDADCVPNIVVIRYEWIWQQASCEVIG